MQSTTLEKLEEFIKSEINMVLNHDVFLEGESPQFDKGELNMAFRIYNKLKEISGELPCHE